MKVMMLCNSLMEQLKTKHGMPNGKPESWVNGVYNMMQKTSDFEVMYLFPANENISFSEGNTEFRSYPQKHADKLEPGQIKRFAELLDSFAPDIIHVLGTEYTHTYAMVKACEEAGCLDKLLVHIQGLVKYYCFHYCSNLPIRIIYVKSFRDLLKGGGASER